MKTKFIILMAVTVAPLCAAVWYDYCYPPQGPLGMGYSLLIAYLTVALLACELILFAILRLYENMYQRPQNPKGK